VTRAHLSLRAYQEVRTAIGERRIQPGTHLSQRSLSEMLGVSRTPAREALRRLELEGFVERRANGRQVVHSLSREELQEIFFVRELLQGYASRLAAFRISDEELRTLDALIVRDLEALEQGDIDRLVEVNEQLHGVIVHASRNRTLRQLITDLDARIYGMKVFAIGDMEDQRSFVNDHIVLVRHLREGDWEAASGLAREHVDKGLRLLLKRSPADPS
jgi:DNA-binding GntR family transcriptional regulator